ncbi:MAG TPA: response regulator transcription factor [Candidatus Enterousia avicola]|uniref:Response regulator transcription factor n=1 Tax=Candidatus Enterousia avicola TaxID=2840787 RepID=A0A9D1MRZ3_9PROT|nr:response regulator transcription factor [Candidatus Enterousia avicola]
MNKTVLIIDDDDMLRKTLTRGLRDNNFEVITAESAETAEELIKRIEVDAIVLDRMMGGKDGLTFLKDMRDKGSNVPVIMLTAMSGAENAIDGLSGGANDYLAKPFQLKELVLRLNNIIKNYIKPEETLPEGLIFTDEEFFIKDTSSNIPRILPLSGEEKKLLRQLTTPIGNISPAAPMVAKRLRNKLNVVLSGVDIITIRGRGYKLIRVDTIKNNNGVNK